MVLALRTLEENDFYDEDEDVYLDRTGQIEEQREKRRLRALVGHSLPLDSRCYTVYDSIICNNYINLVEFSVPFFF